MSILIGADIVPTKSNMKNFEQGDLKKLLDDDLLYELKKADYRIFNLEVPLVDVQRPITKCGPNLIASTKSVIGMKALDIDFFTLANNHILDQGEEGLDCTIKTLNSVGIAFAGVGNTYEEAAKPYILEVNEKKIGIYCCAEHEFSIVTENNAGANPFEPLESLDHIQALKEKVDYVIVLYHGGKEHYRYPSPYLQKVCRKMVDKGANLVVCQHTHCIGCEEKYKDGTIVYGQGNFLFDGSDNECWNTSLLIEINDMFEINYIPLIKNGNSVSTAKNYKNKIMNDFYSRTNQIQEIGFIEKEYRKISKCEFDRYLSKIQGDRYNSLLFRAINKLFRHKLKKVLINRIYTGKELSFIYNLLYCEVHREIFLAGLRESIHSFKIRK